MNEENNNLEKQLSDVRGTLNAALRLLADIRRAVGWQAAAAFGRNVRSCRASVLGK